MDNESDSSDNEIETKGLLNDSNTTDNEIFVESDSDKPIKKNVRLPSWTDICLHSKKAIFVFFFITAMTIIIPLSYLIWQKIPSTVDSLEDVYLPDGFEASIWASELDLPRTLISLLNGDFLLATRSGKIYVMWDDNKDGKSDENERSLLATIELAGHGIELRDGFIYASSTEKVYRWKYTIGQRTQLGIPDVVITGIPPKGHNTRTIIFSDDGDLFVSCGSISNVDNDSSRSRILRFNISNIEKDGIPWETGYLFADGLRNTVGLAFDDLGRLWGVDNGIDNLIRDDIGGDLHENNPGEELNLFQESGSFYGYPYCWTEYDLISPKAKGKGTQWAHPQFLSDGIHGDNWCQRIDNVVPPRYVLRAHTAPLAIMFYNDTNWPVKYKGGLFVALHGSWNRKTPIGYQIVFLSFLGGLPTADEVFFKHLGSENWVNNIRPSGITMGKKDKCMYMTSDASGHIIKICYKQNKL